MKLTLYNAISIDGFIATKEGNSDWVSETDWDNFARFVSDNKVVIMGSNTYVESGDDFPYDCELNIVMTSQESLLNQTQDDSLVFTNVNIENILVDLDEKGYETALLIGGGLLNGSFVKAELINELVLVVHPLILGDGIKLFEGERIPEVKLELLSSVELNEGLVQLTYKVIK